MSDAIRLLLDRARRDAARCRSTRAIVVGGWTAATTVPALSVMLGPPRSFAALIAVPVAMALARLRRGPTDFTLARSLDERFATNDLFATAMHVDDDDAIGRAIIAQATAAAGRLAGVDLAANRSADRRRLAAAGVAVAAALTLSAVVAPSARATARPTASSASIASATPEPMTADHSGGSPGTTRREEIESTDASNLTAASATTPQHAGRSPAGGTGASQTAMMIDLPSPARSEAAARSIGSVASGEGAGRRDPTAGIVASGIAARGAIEVAAPTIADAPVIARPAIDAGRVPATSRALVRAFFDTGEPAR